MSACPCRRCMITAVLVAAIRGGAQALIFALAAFAFVWFATA